MWPKKRKISFIASESFIRLWRGSCVSARCCGTNGNGYLEKQLNTPPTTRLSTSSFRAWACEPFPPYLHIKFPAFCCFKAKTTAWLQLKEHNPNRPGVRTRKQNQKMRIYHNDITCHNCNFQGRWDDSRPRYKPATGCHKSKVEPGWCESCDAVTSLYTGKADRYELRDYDVDLVYFRQA